MKLLSDLEKPTSAMEKLSNLASVSPCPYGFCIRTEDKLLYEKTPGPGPDELVFEKTPRTGHLISSKKILSDLTYPLIYETTL